jgi:predicted site-specific integrase-resolvase
METRPAQDRGPAFAILVVNLSLLFARPKATEVVIINQGEETAFEEDLAKDVLEIITVFSARLCGRRSRKSQQLIDGVGKAVEDAT